MTSRRDRLESPMTEPHASAAPAPQPAELLFDPFAPGFTDDPYPQYTAVRAAAPVYQHPFGFWLLTGYAEVSSLLRPARLSVEHPHIYPDNPIIALHYATHGAPATHPAARLSLP